MRYDTDSGLWLTADGVYFGSPDAAASWEAAHGIAPAPAAVVLTDAQRFEAGFTVDADLTGVPAMQDVGGQAYFQGRPVYIKRLNPSAPATAIAPGDQLSFVQGPGFVPLGHSGYKTDAIGNLIGTAILVGGAAVTAAGIAAAYGAAPAAVVQAPEAAAITGAPAATNTVSLEEIFATQAADDAAVGVKATGIALPAGFAGGAAESVISTSQITGAVKGAGAVLAPLAAVGKQLLAAFSGQPVSDQATPAPSASPAGSSLLPFLGLGLLLLLKG